MKASNLIQQIVPEFVKQIFQHLIKKQIGFLSLILIMILNITSACIVTPDGYMTTDGYVSGGVGLDINPQILDYDNSFVTVRVGPRFYASDAYLLAYNHCLDRGMYAYEVSPWSHSASIVRDLRYDCRPTYIAPPLVYQFDQRNTYRYNYFNDYYFRNHRSNYHYRPPSGVGFWNKHNNHNQPTPNHGNHGGGYQGPGYTYDGRVTTPSSPRSYNPNKDRYVPRNSGGYNSTPPPSNIGNKKPSWWGGGRNSSNNNSNSSGPSRYDSPKSYPSAPTGVSPSGNSNGSKPSFWNKSNGSTKPEKIYDVKSSKPIFGSSKNKSESSQVGKPSWMR